MEKKNLFSEWWSSREEKEERRKEKEEKEGNSEPRLRYKRIEMKRFESALLVRSFDLPSFRPSPLPRLPLPRPLPQLEWIACVHGKALLVMVAHAVTTTREKQEERYTLRLRLWRAALLTIINMIAIIREPACVLIASQRPPWTMAVLLSGGMPFFTPDFSQDFSFVGSSIREGLIFSRCKSCSFSLFCFKRLKSRFYLVIGRKLLERVVF